MNWDLIIGAGSVALPIAVALWKWGTTITKFMASTEQRISQLEKAEDTVCNRLEAMEQRQTERHERITKAITTLREELIASNSIKPKS
jgi:hypothetical protein